ncbi:hypothetical protein ABKV19_024903 [Rosa sericea]
MAVAENAPSFDNSSESNAQTDLENPPKPKMDSAAVVSVDPNLQSNGADDQNSPELEKAQMGQMQNGFESNGVAADDHQVVKAGGYGTDQSSNGDENFKRDMRDLEELLSKLNPMAQEFIPLSLANNQGFALPGGFGYTNNLLLQANSGNGNGFMGKRKKNGYSNQARRRNYYKLSLAQREEMIRRTVYVSDIDQQVTEENLAALFINCGQVVDCRVCGDPNSVLRFAFIEFTDEEGAMAALSLSGTMLGYYPVRVLPSKTAIAPVNPTFLPRMMNVKCAQELFIVPILTRRLLKLMSNCFLNHFVERFNA